MAGCVTVRVTILGCCGSIPGPDQAASGYLLEADGFTMGIDLGNGTLARLQAVRDPFGLDALLLSHLHPDHCADFSALTVLRRYHPAPPFDTRERRLPVYAPSQAPARLANAYAPHEAERLETDLSDVFEFHALHHGVLRIGPFEVTAVPVTHPTESFGMRVAHGARTFAYTATPVSAPRWTNSHRESTCCWRRPPGPTPTTGHPGCTYPDGRPGNSPRGRASAGCCSPTSLRGPTAKRCCGRRVPATTGPSGSSSKGRSTTSERRVARSTSQPSTPMGMISQHDSSR